MRRTEWRVSHQMSLQCPRDRVNAGYLKRFIERELGENFRKRPGKHRFPGAGRPVHCHVVSSSRRKQESALRALLSPHVRKINRGYRSNTGGSYSSLLRLQFRRFLRRPFFMFFMQVFHEFLECFYAEDGNAFNQRPFGGVFLGKIDLFESLFLCFLRQNKDAFNGTHGAVQRKFPQKQFSRRIKRNIVDREKIRDRHGQIKTRPFFFQISGSKRDNHLLVLVLGRCKS